MTKNTNISEFFRKITGRTKNSPGFGASMSKTKVLNFVQKYTMIIALVLVTLFFTVGTNGNILMPQNITNIIA